MSARQAPSEAQGDDEPSVSWNVATRGKTVATSAMTSSSDENRPPHLYENDTVSDASSEKGLTIEAHL